jgi:hypothetical protein
MWRRRKRTPAREELMALARSLAEIDHREARLLAELSAVGRCATRARARVLRPDSEAVIDLLAALEYLADSFPISRRTRAGAAAFTGASDLLIATHGHGCLSPAQRMALSRAARHALETLDPGTV